MIDTLDRIRRVFRGRARTVKQARRRAARTALALVDQAIWCGRWENVRVMLADAIAYACHEVDGVPGKYAEPYYVELVRMMRHRYRNHLRALRLGTHPGRAMFIPWYRIAANSKRFPPQRKAPKRFARVRRTRRLYLHFPRARFNLEPAPSPTTELSSDNLIHVNFARTPHHA